jgi:hypothetical protein
MTARADWDNAKLWERHDGINVFAEHSRTVSDKKTGKKRTIRFDKDRLERIARKCNERDAKNQPCPLVIGHTDDDQPETRQPDIVGYARKYAVRYDDALGKHVINCSYYLKRDRADEAKEYPRTSVEIWDADNFFDPISLLKRTPQLDLGQWTYSQGGKMKLRYSMDDEYEDKEPAEDRGGPPGDRDADAVPDAEEGPPGDRDAEEAPHAQGPEGVPPDFHQNFSRCMAHYHQNVKYGLGEGGGTDAIPKRPPAEEVPTRMSKPKPKTAAPPSPARDARKSPEDMRMDRVEKMVKGLTEEVRSLKHERDGFAVKAERAELRERLRDDLAGKRYDAAREVEVLLPMSGEDREDRIAYLKEALADDPAGATGGMVDTGAGRPTTYRKTDADGRRTAGVKGGVESGNAGEPAGLASLSEDEYDRALDYVRRHPDDEQAHAVQYARGERTLAGEAVPRNGKSRR